MSGPTARFRATPRNAALQAEPNNNFRNRENHNNPYLNGIGPDPISSPSPHPGVDLARRGDIPCLGDVMPNLDTAEVVGEDRLVLGRNDSLNDDCRIR